MVRSRAPRPNLAAALATALLLGLLALAPEARAHATLVVGSLRVSPDPPVPGEQLTITLSLEDTLLVPVEKARVRVELRDLDPATDAVPASSTGSEATAFLERPADVASQWFTETAVKGTYQGAVTAPPAGVYTLSVRDTTFLNEEAIANVALAVGAGPNGTIAFILPPTPVKPKSLSTWLFWLLGVPLAVGLATTILVLRKPPAPRRPEGATAAGGTSASDDAGSDEGSEGPG